MIREVAFINAIKGQAIHDMKKYGILASLTIAQAILESGWGSSLLSIKGNNLFGIKSTNWHGDSVNMPTKEYINNRWIIVDDFFRKYNSWSESLADHTKLLLNPRYSNLVGERDYKRACDKIQKDGYATDPSYANLLISLIEQYKLYEYDNNVIVEGVLNMDIKTLQNWLNINGFTDQNGNKLVVDGVIGQKTIYAKEKAKAVLNYVLK